MKTVWNILFLQKSRWLMGLSDGATATFHEIPVDKSEPAAAASAESTVAAALAITKKHGAVAGPLVVALPSSQCFAVSVPTDGLLRKQRHDGLLYRMEEHLPIDAEQVTADFIAHGNTAMGVATCSTPLRPILEAFESAGIDVAHICPAALLIHETVRLAADDSKSEPALRCDIIAADADNVDLILAKGRELVVWRSVHALASLVQSEHEQLVRLSDASESIKSVRFAPGLHEWMVAPPDSTVGSNHTPDAVLIPTVLRVFRLLREGRPPVVDLRRGALAGRSVWSRAAIPARAAVLAACFVLLAVGAVATRHGNESIARAESADRDQAALFRKTFPNQAVPAAPVSRFRSEAAKAKGTSGTGDAVPRPGRSLADLSDLLAGLPRLGGIRFRLLEARIDADRIYLDGQARSHADADRLASGLRETLEYTLDPPRTQNLTGKAGQGVSFTLSGFREQATP